LAEEKKCAKPIDMKRLGAREVQPKVLDFGVYLPGISSEDGDKLYVKIIHERDQFLQDVPPLLFPMSHSPDPEYGDYWHAQINLDKAKPKKTKSAKTQKMINWGSDGKYVYRYYLESPKAMEPIDWIIDPFAREFGIGKLSSVTVGYKEYEWSKPEESWKTPGLDDLIMYELMITEFGGCLEGAIDRLDYLADLGINCVDVMPVSNVAEAVDWGYHPVGYFGVDERFGKTPDMQRLIDQAHQRGIAVIFDMVYGHTDDLFPYAYLYDRLNGVENPFIGPFAKNDYGKSTDFNKRFTRDFFLTVNHRMLDTYHVDGFRYDCVPNYWDGPTGNGYACLVYETYRMVKEMGDVSGYWQRFFDGEGNINLIQCAEHLEGPKEILQNTYSNCVWQNETLGKAEDFARNKGGLSDLGLLTGLCGYPEMVTIEAGEMKKTALQYIENHDHARFVCNFGTSPQEIEEPLRQLKEANKELCPKLASHVIVLKDGDLAHWYRVQPYLIAILMAKGIPMLWQGQEFGENYHVPREGWGRVKMMRPMRWDYFYSERGRPMISLVRKLIRLRHTREQLRTGDHYFYNNHEFYQSKGIVLFSRRHQDRFSLIALNFSDQDQTVPFVFPLDGDYFEDLHGNDVDSLNLKNVASGIETNIVIPSNYGRVWSI
jgi:maltooligosyltrehalose trehalohydrolase